MAKDQWQAQCGEKYGNVEKYQPSRYLGDENVINLEQPPVSNATNNVIPQFFEKPNLMNSDGTVKKTHAAVELHESYENTSGVMLWNDGQYKQISPVREGRSTYHIFTEDEMNCYTQWFTVDPSVWIYKKGNMYHPVVVIKNSRDVTSKYCTTCNSCVGCTSCYNCYDHVYKGQGHPCDLCNDTCVSGCDESCTTGCTTGCVANKVGCTTDERSINWNDDDEGCTPSSQGCDDGCYGPGSIVGKCGEEVEYICDSLTTVDELCDECRWSCQGGCQAHGGCQTCSVGTAQRSTPSECGGRGDYDPPAPDWKCGNSCNGCTSPCDGVIPEDPAYKPCKNDTGKTECAPPCVSIVVQPPIPEDYCRNGLNESPIPEFTCIGGRGMVNINRPKECTGGTVSCSMLTAGKMVCTGNAKIGCPNNNAIKPEDIEADGGTIIGCHVEGVDYIWCLDGVGNIGLVCKGDCNTASYGVSNKGRVTINGKDPTQCECAVGGVAVAQLIPNKPTPACGKCDNTCVSGCDGSCTGGCTTACTGGTSQPCTNCTGGTAHPCTGCDSGTGCRVCTASNQGCGTGQNCPNNYDPTCPDHCPSCTTGCQGGVPGSKPPSVSPNIYNPGYC